MARIREQSREDLIGHDGAVKPHPHPIPRPAPTPAPPPFRAAHYTASLDSIEILNTRSRHEDSDKCSVSVGINNENPVTVTKDLGDLNNGVFQVGLHVGPSAINAPTDKFAFNYLVLNSGHQDWETTNKTLTQIGNTLASAGAKAATTAAGTLIGASVGGVVLPVIGSILGAAAGWLVGELTGLLTADCDGPVAVEQVALTGEQLWTNTQHGSFTHSTYHPGIDSAHGCGSNSIYIAHWSISRT